jgi:arylsulfatase A
MILTHCPFDPTPDSTDWDPKRLGSTSYKGDRNDPQRHFRDMVAFADKSVGQIVAQLKKSGIRDNTLIVFTGDNGTDKPIVTPWNGRKVVGGKGSMTDEGTRVPLIANWPTGIQKPGRVVDDLADFTDMMPTLCELSNADLPKGHPNDGTSLLPVFQNNSKARKKDWIYIWYRNQVMVRNKKYSLLANHDGTNASLTRYKGQFEGGEIDENSMDKKEKNLQNKFIATINRLAKTRLSTASEEGRIMGLKNKSNR